MENNETKSCVVRDELLPKAKVFFTSKTFLVIAACVVCFFVGFFIGNAAGKSSQRKADAAIIAAARAQARPRPVVTGRRPVVRRSAATVRPVVRQSQNRPVVRTSTANAARKTTATTSATTRR